MAGPAQLVLCAGVALACSAALAESLAPRPERMREVLEDDGGLATAEAASFRLAARRLRPKAGALVKQTVAAAQTGREALAEALQRLALEKGDWAEILCPERLVHPGPPE